MLGDQLSGQARVAEQLRSLADQRFQVQACAFESGHDVAAEPPALRIYETGAGVYRHAAVGDDRVPDCCIVAGVVGEGLARVGLPEDVHVEQLGDRAARAAHGLPRRPADEVVITARVQLVRALGELDGVWLGEVGVFVGDQLDG